MMSSDLPAALARRRFLKHGGIAAGAALTLSPLGKLLAAAGAPHGAHTGYGPLAPVRDLSTGLPLLELPAGFSYRTFGWTGAPLDSGRPTPAAHDGMGIVRTDGDVVTLVRNHEVGIGDGSFAPDDATFDAACGGGTVTLRFDTRSGEVLESRASLSGTLRNCSGGITPWNSWLSCEEFVSARGTVAVDSALPTLGHDHGFVFEVPVDGRSDARPLTGLGQFRHEAVAVHARSGIVYLTEDMEPAAGFYRFVPDVPGALIRGGRLQMLKAVGAPDLRVGHRTGQRFKVEWVAIEQPTRGIDGDGNITGVLQQGLAGGGSRFVRLEGCIAGDDVVYFTATNGGDAHCGQVWAYYPERAELQLVYQSPDAATLDYPDNVVISPRGGLVLCQDSIGDAQKLYGLTMHGDLFTFARNVVRLDGTNGFSGDFSSAEWAGSCFSADGKWLFANVYSPGFSVAITGPWRQGLI